MIKNTLALSLFIFILAGVLYPQTAREEFFSNTKLAGGLYLPYPYTPTIQTPVPEGYVPFYISHYGRHGSRYVISADCHTVPQKILDKASKAGKLTEAGKSLLERINVLATDAAGRYGDLSPVGVREQKGIAERMFKSFPQVFSAKEKGKCSVYSRSTQVPRCILSMSAFDERLKELNPEITVVQEASQRNTYLNNDCELIKDTLKKIESSFLKRQFNPSRLIASLFSDTVYAKQIIEDPGHFAHEIFSAAINVPNLENIHFTLLDIFTTEEIYALSQYSNMQMYYWCGPSGVNGKNVTMSASLLLKNIIDCADSAIQKGSVSADLRFGHDSYIIPLLALLEIKDMNNREDDPDKIFAAWTASKVSPMGANLQLIFFRNEKSGDVLVKLLHNEKEVQVPVPTDMAPYYHWKDFKAYYEKKALK
jgi:hypothetical protein